MILTLLFYIIISSCTVRHTAHQYPHKSLLGYNPANTTNIQNLYHMDNRGNLSLMPNDPNAPPAENMGLPPGYNPNPIPANIKKTQPYYPHNTRPKTNLTKPMIKQSNSLPSQPNKLIQTPNTYRPKQAQPKQFNLPQRRYPPLNNYPYPYKTSKPKYGMPNYSKQKPHKNYFKNLEPQINNKKNNFAEVTPTYRKTPPKTKANVKSNYLTNMKKQNLGLIDGNYFVPGSTNNLNSSNNLGYGYKINTYGKDNKVIDDIDNNILDNMIRNDPLNVRFKLESLPSL